MITYDPFRFMSGCIYYATAISVVVSVSVLNPELTFMDVILLCVFLLILISEGRDIINESEIDTNE